MQKKAPVSTVPANPANWSPQSQRSVSAEWTKEYTSFHYNCWRCRTSALFSAEDQRYTYEVKKAPIDQNRILCQDCWRRSNQIAAGLSKAEQEWAESKQSLQLDKVFLDRWARLLDERDQYVPYRTDTAKKNMLARLLRNA